MRIEHSKIKDFLCNFDEEKVNSIVDGWDRAMLIDCLTYYPHSHLMDENEHKGMKRFFNCLSPKEKIHFWDMVSRCPVERFVNTVTENLKVIVPYVSLFVIENQHLLDDH